MTKREKINNIFLDYFGEENIDIQGDSIIIRFPSITISNEYDESHEIKELYAKVDLDGNRLNNYFTLLRAEVTTAEAKADYAHSHLPGIVSQFTHPCLGRGPIKNTCTSLMMEYNEDTWAMFCIELDKYVRVESITGGPYRRICGIGVSTQGLSPGYSIENKLHDLLGIDPSVERCLDAFIRDRVLNMEFNFNYINDSYGIAMSPYEFTITISNEFIDWCNSNQYPSWTELNLLKEVEFIGEAAYLREDVSEVIPRDGTRLFDFKGTPVHFKVVGEQENSMGLTTILKRECCSYIMYEILKIVNFTYGRNESITCSFVDPKFGKNAIII